MSETIKRSISYADAISLLNVYASLNGREGVAFDPKANREIVVHVPFSFSAQTTMQIARNINRLKDAVDDYNTAVDAVRARKQPPETTKKDVEELRSQKLELELTAIPYESLRVSENLNNIPPGNIAFLSPWLTFKE